MDKDLAVVQGTIVNYAGGDQRPTSVIEEATDIADDLAQIINERKLYTIIRKKKYVHVEGWSTMGAMLGVFPREVETLQIDNGWKSTVELVRINDNAVIGRGSAICTRGESSWKDRDEYAVHSMALTRATGKAFRLSFSWIMKLAGYEPTPAEEMKNDTVSMNHNDEPQTPANIKVPFTKAKQLFDGQAPTMEQLYQNDSGYVDWIATNVEDNDVGRAARDYLASLDDQEDPAEEPDIDFSVVDDLDFMIDFNEIQKKGLGKTFRAYIKEINSILTNAGYDNKFHRNNLKEQMFGTDNYRDYVAGWYRLLYGYARYVLGNGVESKPYAKSVVAFGIEKQVDFDEARGIVEEEAEDDTSEIPI